MLKEELESTAFLARIHIEETKRKNILRI